MSPSIRKEIKCADEWQASKQAEHESWMEQQCDVDEETVGEDEHSEMQRQSSAGPNCLTLQVL